MANVSDIETLKVATMKQIKAQSQPTTDTRHVLATHATALSAFAGVGDACSAG